MDYEVSSAWQTKDKCYDSLTNGKKIYESYYHLAIERENKSKINQSHAFDLSAKA